MAELVKQIKSVAEYGSDGLLVAVERKLNDTQRQALKECLDSLTEVLPATPSKQVVKKTGRRSSSTQASKDVLNDVILPQIRRKLSEYEEKEIQWKVDFTYGTEFAKMSMDEMKNTHVEICRNEKAISNLDLVAKYHRGMLYLTAYDHTYNERKEKKIVAKDWLWNEFGVKYETALNYMTFASLIRNYPGTVP